MGAIKRGAGGQYYNPLTGEKAPGVTGVINNLPKPFLQYWRGKVVAEFAADNVGALAQMLLDAHTAADHDKARKAAVDWLKNSPTRDTGQAADIGTAVHDLCERMARGEELGLVHPDFKPYVERYDRFLQKYQPEFLFLEDAVWSETYGYAGTFDAIAKIDGECLILDTKTTRSGVHAEVALQMTAYARADYIITTDESPRKLSDTSDPELIKTPMPQIDGAAVVHLRPDSSAVVPVAVDDPDVWETFLHLLTIRRWEQETSKRVLGAPLEF